MGVPQCKAPLISGNTLLILLSDEEAKTGRHQGQELCWSTVRVQQSYCSPSHLHPALAATQQLPEADLSLAPIPLYGQCSLSVATVSEPMAAAGSCHWLQDLDLVLYPNTAQIRLQESSRNISALAPVTNRLSEKRFFPPACYKTILNGDCNLSTLNKWGSCILKLISHQSLYQIITIALLMALSLAVSMLNDRE